MAQGEPNVDPMKPPDDIGVDINHYRSLLKRVHDEAHEFHEIGGGESGTRYWRWLAWTVVLLLVGALFCYLFYHFTNNLRVALVVVAGMMIYMIFTMGLAEGMFEDRGRR